MKKSFNTSIVSLHAFILTAGLLSFGVQKIKAATSPYVTEETNVPLNQSTNDSINGVLPFFVSDTPLEGGSADRLTDATSTNTPTSNVILGPENTWVGVAWDFGEPPEGFIWKLDRVDAWIAGEDYLRKGYRADLSVSLTGGVDDFAIITNSLHWSGLTQNAQFNHIRYDFPSEFVAGANPDMDKYPVSGFRYLRLNSRGDNPNGDGTPDWQTRFVEFDVWVSPIPGPDTPVISTPTRAQNGDVVFTWNAIPSRTYEVNYKTNLLQPDWIALDSIIPDSEIGSVTNNAGNDPERYYRVILKTW